MNDSTRVTRRAWGFPAVTVAAVVTAAGLALPVAAFGSSQSTNAQKALAYSHCMRSHGIRKFPDPGSRGTVPKVTLQQLGVSLSQWQKAQSACRKYLPNGGGPSQAQVQQWMNGMWKFARCMRAHGVSNWPDPVIDAGGNPEFYLDGQINQYSPRIKARIHDCIHFLPSFAISPGNPVACAGANPGPDVGPNCGGCGCTRRH